MCDKVLALFRTSRLRFRTNSNVVEHGTLMTFFFDAIGRTGMPESPQRHVLQAAMKRIVLGLNRIASV